MKILMRLKLFSLKNLNLSTKKYEFRQQWTINYRNYLPMEAELETTVETEYLWEGCGEQEKHKDGECIDGI